MPTFVEQFPAVRIESVRLAVGGRRKFKKMKSCTIGLPDGREVRVALILHPGTLGGQRTYFCCPVCGRKCCTLRVIPDEPGLCCNCDLQKLYGAKFISQTPDSRRLRDHVDAGAVRVPLDGWAAPDPPQTG